MPELRGHLEGTAMQVLTPHVSAVDLAFEAQKDVIIEDVNKIVCKTLTTIWDGYLHMIQNLKYLSILITLLIPQYLRQGRQE